MKKINILVVTNEFNGIGYYRINSPYISLKDDDININFLSMTDFTFKFNEENLREYQFIIYHKTIPAKSKDDADELMKLKFKYNIKFIVDIDDHWLLDSTHPMYSIYNQNNTKEKLINNIRIADYVTTTTPYLADVIKEYNKNVVVFENAVNTIEQQWIPRKIESEKTRFLWGGSITHLTDLKLLEKSLKLDDDDKLLNNVQMYLCGFDLRVKDLNNNFSISNPDRSPWGKIEKIFTNNYKSIKNNEYLKWLKQFIDGEDLYGYNELFKNEFYQRRWSKPIFNYGEMYNEADVALAPLVNTPFNNVKSQLKIIEAGIHKCPIIASNNPPYTLDIVDGKHGFLIDDGDKTGWYDKIKYFSENPNAVKDMGESLNELVLEKYTLEKINNKRIDFFKIIAD